MTAFLTLDSISLATPDGRPLFDGLTLALGRERTGVVGRNGCGKSTLLRLIAGEIEPASGSVRRTGSIGVLPPLADHSLTLPHALRAPAAPSWGARPAGEISPRAASSSWAARGQLSPKRAIPPGRAPKRPSTELPRPCATPNARFRKPGRRRPAATRPAAPGAPRVSRTRCSWTPRNSAPKTAVPAKATLPIA